MTQTTQMGRMIRGTRFSGVDVVINLDHVTHINPCKHPVAREDNPLGRCTRVWYDSNTFDDLDEDFDSFCLKVMTSEFQALTGYAKQPTPPLSRRELAEIRTRDLHPREDCDPLYVGTEG